MQQLQERALRITEQQMGRSPRAPMRGSAQLMMLRGGSALSQTEGVGVDGMSSSATGRCRGEGRRWTRSSCRRGPCGSPGSRWTSSRTAPCSRRSLRPPCRTPCWCCCLPPYTQTRHRSGTRIALQGPRCRVSLVAAMQPLEVRMVVCCRVRVAGSRALVSAHPVPCGHCP